MRFLLHTAATLVCAFAPSFASAGSKDASDQCPFGGVGRNFDGLVLCVPADNERYLLTQDGVDWMAWLGDDPIPRPTKDKPAAGNGMDVTLARAWIGEAIVGTADSTSGQAGFDRFMRLIAASIMQKARSASAADGFTADVPVDESGIVQRFAFTYLEPDLLQGKRMEKSGAGPLTILFRPSTEAAQPHVLLCGGNEGAEISVHVCMSMLDMAGHRVGIIVTGTELKRSFHISEEVGADLASFIVRPTAP